MGGNDSRGGRGGSSGGDRSPRGGYDRSTSRRASSERPTGRGEDRGSRGAGGTRGGGRGDGGPPDKPIKRSLSGKPPPRRSASRGQGTDPRRPSLPSQRPEIPGAVYREIKRTSREQDVSDVANAVGTAATAVEEGDLDRARELLEWAKGRATRSVSIREGLGVCCYMMGDFEAAQRELQAYRRMSGRADQNHLLADAARALGRTERVIELVEEMAESHAAGDVPLDRLVEAIIVHAGMLADDGQSDAAISIIERAPLPEGGVSVPHGRAWYAAATIAEDMGDIGRAREYFEAAMMVDDDFLGAEARLDALSDDA